MADAAVQGTGGGAGEGQVVIRRDWKRRLLNELFALFIALLLLLAGALVLLDTAPGHRFIADRITRSRAAPEAVAGFRSQAGLTTGRPWTGSLAALAVLLSVAAVSTGIGAFAGWQPLSPGRAASNGTANAG